MKSIEFEVSAQDSGRRLDVFLAERQSLLTRSQVQKAIADKRVQVNGIARKASYRLRPGEGILSNNSLHNRTGFRDDPQTGHVRLLYRARYYERIAGTDLHSVYGDLAASAQGQE